MRRNTIMATTGELRAIVQELHLVDVGEAESYLGEEALVEEEAIVVAEEITPMVLDTDAAVLEACKCTTCDLVHV
jgi:hypothetical protein